MNWPTRTMLSTSQDGTLLPGAISIVLALSARIGDSLVRGESGLDPLGDATSRG